MKFAERSLQVDHIHEPELEFAFGQKTAHPKDGLHLYGPHARARKAKEIRVGVVGTSAGIGYFRTWSRELQSMVQVPPPGKGEKANRLHLADFPGLEETFGIYYEPDELRAESHQSAS